LRPAHRADSSAGLVELNVEIRMEAQLYIPPLIISTWSWKKINCSMTGDALSCSVRFNHVVIVSYESFKLYLWSLNPVHLSATLEVMLITYRDSW